MECCMCRNPVNLSDKINTLIPNQCYAVNGMKAHRICRECWFDPVKGFALEGKSHKCPGCLDHLPLI